MNFLTHIDNLLPIPLFHPFRMTKKEKILFDKTISHSSLYLEFGMGGSTFRVLKKSEAQVVSIDSSESWIAMMRNYKFVMKMEYNSKLQLMHVDIGPTHEWGRPVRDTHRELYPNYSSSVFKEIQSQQVDTVLVDGRFRIACALKTLIECGMNDNLRIMFHDFHRAHYQPILDYTDMEEQADDLVVLKPKANLNVDALLKAYEEYKYNDD